MSGFADVFRYSKAGDLKSLKKLVDENPFEAKKKDPTSGNYTAMHYAAVAGQEGAIATLLEAGADVNSVDEHGATPLHLASEMGFTYCISALIAAEAEVNSHNHFTGVPLRYAVANGHTLGANLLIAAGADVNVVDTIHGNTPLHFAAAGGHSECISSLINSGAGVNQVNQHGKSALFLAAECMAATSPECLRILILKKADVELKTAKGDSALHAAAIAGNVDGAQFLMEEGMDPNVQNMDNQSSLHLAALHSRYPCLRALIAGGGDLRLEDSYGQTVLDCIDDAAVRRELEAKYGK